MPALLVRNMPAFAYRRVKKMAKEENLSLSQEAVSLILFALDKKEKEKIKNVEEEKERNDVFARIEALRKKIHAKYGNQKQEESWKIIRRMRNERMKRYE